VAVDGIEDARQMADSRPTLTEEAARHASAAPSVASPTSDPKRSLLDGSSGPAMPAVILFTRCDGDLPYRQGVRHPAGVEADGAVRAGRSD